MRKLSETMQYITPRNEFVAESRQAKEQAKEQAQIQESAGPIPSCPKSLDISPSDLQDDGTKVLKFEAFVNECLKNENKRLK